ncbi:MAG: translation initiation factor IF-1 [Patescibacteria group bacterium]|jgi:translation initiation factor IF-1
MKDGNLILIGEVIESLPNTTFRVKVEGAEGEVLCYLSGKMRKNFIRILPGDKVKIEVTPYDKHRGRIIYRN